MSAELLREAASLMWERATAAPVRPGPWEREFSDVIRTDVPFGAPGYLIAEVATIPDAEHIASWHPAVALAVADLLDELLRSLSVFGEPADDDPLWRKPTASAALAVARAYMNSGVPNV